MIGDQKIYQGLYNASSLSGFLIWLGIAICHLRFRKAWVAQGRSINDLKFKSRFFPYGPWLAVVLFLVVLFGANIGVFQTPVFSWFDFVTGYVMIPVFIVLYFGHKLVNKTQLMPLQGLQLRIGILMRRPLGAMNGSKSPALLSTERAGAPHC